MHACRLCRRSVRGVASSEGSTPWRTHAAQARQVARRRIAAASLPGLLAATPRSVLGSVSARLGVLRFSSVCSN